MRIVTFCFDAAAVLIIMGVAGLYSAPMSNETFIRICGCGLSLALVETAARLREGQSK